MEQVATRVRHVTIRAANPNVLLPKEVQGEVTRNIGSKLDRNGKGVLMGIEEEEQKRLLPKIIRIGPNSDKWEDEVTDFFANLTIHVPTEGQPLNITTTKKKVAWGGEMIEVDHPDAPLDWIMYKQCLVDNSVAKKESDLEAGTFSFYIEDTEAAKIKEREHLKNTQKIETEYLNLTRLDDEDKYADPSTIKFIALILGKNPKYHELEELVVFIRDLRDISINEIKNGVEYEKTSFISLVKDKKLRDKALILAAVDIGVIIKDGDYYRDAIKEGLILGEGLDQAVDFIRNPTNSDTVLAYREKLRIEKDKQQVA